MQSILTKEQFIIKNLTKVYHKHFFYLTCYIKRGITIVEGLINGGIMNEKEYIIKQKSVELLHFSDELKEKLKDVKEEVILELPDLLQKIVYEDEKYILKTEQTIEGDTQKIKQFVEEEVTSNYLFFHSGFYVCVNISNFVELTPELKNTLGM